MGYFEDAMNQALQAAPELHQMPGVATALGQSQDPANDAQALAQVANVAATTQAYQQVKQRHGWLDSALGDLGGAVGAVAKPVGGTVLKGLALANKPLQMVQHEYRYIRDVYKLKGVGAGLAETLGVTLGATAGLALTDDFQGAVLGGEAAAAAQGQLTYHDVWKSSANSGGSFGRDITRNVIGLNNNKWVSGVLDGLIDLNVDPVAAAGGLAAAARGAEGLGGAVGTAFKGTSMNSVEAVDQARRTLPSYNHALSDIAKLTPAEIVRSYPKFTDIADRLGAASSADDVHQVFRDVTRVNELLGGTGQLPTMTLTRQAMTKVGRGVLANAPDSVDQFLVRPFTPEPTAWDDVAKKFSNKEFDIMAPDATKVVYRLTRFAETDPVAIDVANGFARETDPSRRLEIFNNTVMNTILARAKLDPDTMDPNVLRELRGKISDLTTFGEGKYVTNMDGEDISRVATDALGSERAAGVRMNQIGKTAIPNFIGVKRAAQVLEGYNKIYGAQVAGGATEEAARAAAESGSKLPFHAAADDWVYNHVTGGIFKPLVTLSGGFAQRIALSEAIPRTLDEGFFNTVKATLAGKYATLGQKVTDDDASRVGAAVYAALGGDKGLLANTDAVKIATKQIEANGGDLIHPAIAAGHSGGISDLSPVESKVIDIRKQVQTNPKVVAKAGDDFDLFDKTDPLRIPRWQANLKEAANDPATQASAAAAESVFKAGGTIDDARNAGAMAAAKYIREHPDTYDGRFVRFNNANVGDDWANHWGRITSEGMFGDVGFKNADGSYGVNRDLLRALSDVATPGDIADELTKGRFSESALKAIPLEQQPLRVKGRMTITPDTGSTLQRIADVGHRKFLEPIINTLAREPIFNTEFRKHYESLIESGLLSDDQAVMLANTRAAHSVLPFVHNTAERSQLGYTVRNFMPFYFAQEQAYKRAGRLLASDPGAFRKYQLMMTGLVDSGTGTSDQSGHGYMALPGTGFLTAGAVKAASALGVNIGGSVPSGLSGNLKSLNTVFPFVEDPLPWHKPGPLVSIPLKALENLRPEIGPITNAVIGDQATAGSLWDQIIPNQFIKNSLQALGVRGLTTQQYNSTLTIMQELGDKGKLPDENDVIARQAFVDHVKNQSRILDGVKALISLISPASPRVDIRGQFTGIANEYIKKYGDVATAMQHLREDHPEATPETVFKSTTPLGENVPAYQEAQTWIDNNQDLIHAFPDAAAFLVPQKKGDAFSQAVYNEQLGQHIRQRKTPEQFLKDIYIAAGNAQFYGKDLPAHQDALQQLVNSGDTQGATAERAAFQSYIASTFGPQNPVWWEHFKSPDTDQKKQQAVSGLVQIFARGLAPDTEQSHDVAELIGDWSTHMAALKPGVSSSLASADRTAENANWDRYLKSLATEKPQLVPIINALFRDSGEKPLGTVA